MFYLFLLLSIALIFGTDSCTFNLIASEISSFFFQSNIGHSKLYQIGVLSMIGGTTWSGLRSAAWHCMEKPIQLSNSKCNSSFSIGCNTCWPFLMCPDGYWFVSSQRTTKRNRTRAHINCKSNIRCFDPARFAQITWYFRRIVNLIWKGNCLKQSFRWPKQNTTTIAHSH